MRTARKYMLVSLVFICTFLHAEIEIYFSPNGGFHPQNQKRTITLSSGKKVVATLNNALLDLIGRTEEGGQIKIAMYAFTDRTTQDALIEAAKSRKIKVKLILDAVASWTLEMRKSFKKRILKEMRQAKKEKRIFDFQLKEIYPKSFEDRNRIRKLRDGKKIYGTMHEKFGIFYKKGAVIPIHSFCGSANISWGAGYVFAENRIFFKNKPEIGRQLAEEFARLWNEFGTAVTKNCQSEKYLVISPNKKDVKIISNSKPIDEKKYQRIDLAILKTMDKVDPKNGTIDVAMFSFTHVGLANKIIYLAKKYPKIRVRILMDQTQIQDDDNHLGVLGPYIERSAYFRNIKNIEIRYKWRSNAYAWDKEANSCQLIHWRNLLLHHKCAVINGNTMAIGSYNWSGSAEFRNFENIMIFDSIIPEHKGVIRRFLNEYDTIWNSLKKGEITQKLPNPQVVKGPQGRKLKKKIIMTYNDPFCRKIMKILDTNPKGCTEDMLQKILLLPKEKLVKKINKLKIASLIFSISQEGKKYYQLAD